LRLVDPLRRAPPRVRPALGVHLALVRGRQDGLRVPSVLRENGHADARVWQNPEGLRKTTALFGVADTSRLWLMLNLTVLTWLRFAVWMLLGFIVYFAYSRRNSVLGKRIAKEEELPDRQG